MTDDNKSSRIEEIIEQNRKITEIMDSEEAKRRAEVLVDLLTEIPDDSKSFFTNYFGLVFARDLAEEAGAFLPIVIQILQDYRFKIGPDVALDIVAATADSNLLAFLDDFADEEDPEAEALVMVSRRVIAVHRHLLERR
jgi:hypothetical protein